MSKSLISLLPKIVEQGKKEYEKIMESIAEGTRIKLQTNEIVLPSKDTNYQTLFDNFSRDYDATQWHNRMVYGDNLLVMQALLTGDPQQNLPSMRGKIDLIYIDPPFDSKADYRTKIVLPGTSFESKPTILEQTAYSDIWKDGTASYLAYMYPRLAMMRDLLSETGSIYVHIDWHVGHYVKILLDEIFGKDNLLNEIIWKYPQSIKSSNKKNLSIHDNIYFYSKTYSGYYFTPPIEPYTDKQLARFKYQDENGNFYYDTRRNKENEKIQVKVYLEKTGTPTGDVRYFNRVQGKEFINYGTQKPEKLLERVIEASCPPGGIVADFFGGSGTTAAVAEKLGRKRITSDIGKPACMVMRKRFIDNDSKPYLYQSIGDYNRESFHATSKNTKVGELSQIVLGLYGALPFGDEHPKNIGYIKESRILVVADSPNKLTGITTIKRALEMRNTLEGGWKKVVVLGWNFTSTIIHDIGQLKEDKSTLEVLVIPPNLFDYLKSKKHLSDLVKSKKITFSSLQYLTIKPVHKETINDKDQLTISLDNYILLSPDAMPLDNLGREQLAKVMASEPLALIEYRSVDPDYDGVTFRSIRQDYRGNTDNDSDALRCITKTVLSVATKPGPRRIMVKAVDVFGRESEVEVVV